MDLYLGQKQYMLIGKTGPLRPANADYGGIF